MRRVSCGLLLLLLCVLAGGCGEGAGPPGPVESTGSSDEESGGTPPGTGGAGEEPGDTPEEDLPGVPGSPIDYDNTLFGAGPQSAKESIERVLDSKCPEGDRCGVQVVIEQRGDGDCITEISPRPVDPGGTITIFVGECPGGEVDPEENEETTEPTETGDGTELTG